MKNSLAHCLLGVLAYCTAGFIGCSLNAQSSPPNDLFVNATVVQGTSFEVLFDNTSAGVEPGEPRPDTNSIGRTVWFDWTAPAAGRVDVGGHGASPFDQASRRLAVYTGPALDQLTRVASGLNSLVFMAVEGRVYHIQADTYGGAGSFILALNDTPFVVPQNDNFCNSIQITGTVASAGTIAAVIAPISDATTEPGEPAHLGGAPCKSVWWNWYAQFDGFCSLVNNGSLASNVVFAVYQGTSLGTLNLVAKGTNGVRFVIAGGVTYQIAAVVEQSMPGDVLFSGCLTRNPLGGLPANLLCEPSFENTWLWLNCWRSSFPFGGTWNGPGPDGIAWITLNGGNALWQDFPTVPGRRYQIGFAYTGGGGGAIEVKWDDTVLGAPDVPVGAYGWYWPTLEATATNWVSRVTFTDLHGGESFDAASVICLSDPPTIVTPPASLSCSVGRSAGFEVFCQGTAPLAYQWFFNGSPLEGATGSSLAFNSVFSAAAGQYFVLITNAFGAVTSAPATLSIEATNHLQLVYQPYSDSITVGAYFALSVGVEGPPPIRYQWFWNGAPVVGGTNRVMIFDPFAAGNAGEYKVAVSNDTETVWSMPITLTATTSHVGGRIKLENNFNTGGKFYQIPIYDVDGVTGLLGTNYVAQLYAGATLDLLRPVGSPRPFSTTLPGYLPSGGLTIQVLSVPAYATAYLQVRVWERSKGASYEEARAMGGKFGRSPVFTQTLGSVIAAYPTGLVSFALHAGLPQFTVGRIELAEHRADNTLVWNLIGNRGYQYVIYKSQSQVDWQALMVLNNGLGTTSFIDPAPPSTNSVFYRARILD